MLVLRTPRLLLRPFDLEDEEALFGFEEVGLEEILAGADLDNAASVRVMERLGMSYAGERRVGPQALPATYYRLRREDFDLGNRQRETE